MKWHVFLSLAMVSLILGAGCGEGEDHDHQAHEESSAEEEACSHAQDSPTTLAASTGIAGASADVSQGHTLYEVTLNETEVGSGEYRGYLSFEAPEHADYMIFTSSAVELSVLTSADVALETRVSEVDGCVELMQAHRVSLDAQRYVIELGSAGGPTLSLIIESEAHDHDHD
ncbi:hypothetical protein DV096_04870 [Bradymonadaceae bacterium TMQ3]|nr:hypothetical protein DV096_04870 [Bradymonadaceae bacterium TMQ3]TXC77356.1 hypothetical protein FRC91_01070 [Bradymonadales bacterium TMQ1]